MIRSIFKPERETKGTWRFKEDVEVGEEIIGTVYIKKRTLREMRWEAPSKIVISIEIALP